MNEQRSLSVQHNSLQLKVAGEGTVLVKVLSESHKPITLTMNRILHVPEMSCNLMSVRQIAETDLV